jgi:hypothetical protein
MPAVTQVLIATGREPSTQVRHQFVFLSLKRSSCPVLKGIQGLWTRASNQVFASAEYFATHPNQRIATTTT